MTQYLTIRATSHCHILDVIIEKQLLDISCIQLMKDLMCVK